MKEWIILKRGSGSVPVGRKRFLEVVSVLETEENQLGELRGLGKDADTICWEKGESEPYKIYFLYGETLDHFRKDVEREMDYEVYFVLESFFLEQITQ